MSDQKQNLKTFFINFYQGVVNSSVSGGKELVNFNLAVSRGTTSEANIKLRHDVILKRFLNEYKPLPLDEDRSFSHEQKIAIFRKYDGKCQKCSKTLQFNDPETHYHHTDYYAKGGKTETEKGLLLCKDCHLKVVHGKTG